MKMDQYSELDLLECKLKKVIQELSAYNQVHRQANKPKYDRCVKIKENKKYGKCKGKNNAEKNENRPRSCCCDNDKDETDTETDSECLEKSSTSLFSTLKQLQKIEKELRKKEIELKEKELQDRITCIKLKMAEEELCKKKTKKVEKTTNTTKYTCAKPEKKSCGKVTCECSKYLQKVKPKCSSADLTIDSPRCKRKSSVKKDKCKYPKKDKSDNKDYRKASITDSDCSIESFSKSENECAHKVTKPKKVCGDDVCKCPKKRSQAENLCKGSCGRIRRIVSCKTICCSTGSSLSNVTPKRLKKKPKKGKNKRSNFKDRLVKWYDIQKSWSPCKCSTYTTRQVSSLEKILLDAYGDCFPMALRENPQMCLYDRPIPSKKSHQKFWYRPMCFFIAKLFCTPCFLCFLCCYSCCNLANDSKTSKCDSAEDFIFSGPKTVLLQ